MSAVAGAAVLLLVQGLNRKRRVREQVEALRFEIESNIQWADNIFRSLNYLRDEAWVRLKNEHIGSLNSSIREKVAHAYDRLHALNRCIKIARELTGEEKKNHIAQSEVHRQEFVACAQELLRRMAISPLSGHYPHG